MIEGSLFIKNLQSLVKVTHEEMLMDAGCCRGFRGVDCRMLNTTLVSVSWTLQHVSHLKTPQNHLGYNGFPVQKNPVLLSCEEKLHFIFLY